MNLTILKHKPYLVAILGAVMAGLLMSVGWYFWLTRQTVPVNSALEAYQNSLPSLEARVNNEPENAPLLKEYAHALYVTGNDDKAKDVYTQVVELDPRDSSAYIYIGNYYRKTQDYPSAIKAYQSALDLDQSAVIAGVNLAHMYIYDLQDSEQGFVVLTALIENNSENNDLLILRAKTHEQQGDVASALKDYEAILLTRPDDAAAQNGITRLKTSSE